MAVSPDGQAVLRGGQRGTSAIWRRSRRIASGDRRAERGASAVRAEPDGKVVYVALADEDAG